MKKIILLFLMIILLVGCSSNNENELCNKIDEIDVQTFTEEEKYKELTLILEDNFENYCEDSESDVCNTLSEYIKSTKSEIELENCDKVEGSNKDMCENDNKLAILDKKINVGYMHEEMWAVCNK